MKRILTLVALSLLLLASCQKEEQLSTEIRVKAESVTGSRARFTIAPGNPHAYYTYVLVSELDENFNKPAVNICNAEIRDMIESYAYVQEGDFMTGDFFGTFFYQGTRQITLETLRDDLDFKLITFQINPKTYELLGEPVVTTFHTKPVPQRDLHFQVNFQGETMTITPSDDQLTYFWDYEESELINDNYGNASRYLYKVAGMYQEYGFVDFAIFSGPTIWDFSVENNMEDDTEYTLVICGCEEGEFTTVSTVVRFKYHPGNIEILDFFEGYDM